MMFRGYVIEEAFIRDHKLLSYSNKANEKNDKLNILNYVKKSFEGELILDANQMISDWFPTENESNVFVSHSHADVNVVKQFANYIASGIKHPFVDATVWQSGDDLIKKINDTYNQISGEEHTYYYDEAHKISSNVDLMLAMALNKMIMHCETFILIQSDNAVLDGQTYSPWIMSELNMYYILHELQQQIWNPEILYRSAYSNYASISVEYDVGKEIESLEKINTMSRFENVFGTP